MVDGTLLSLELSGNGAEISGMVTDPDRRFLGNGFL
jgi:hypothetical protein